MNSIPVLKRRVTLWADVNRGNIALRASSFGEALSHDEFTTIILSPPLALILFCRLLHFGNRWLAKLGHIHDAWILHRRVVGGWHCRNNFLEVGHMSSSIHLLY